MARALVTGSTAGLGLEFAWQLAGTGHDLLLVARDEGRLRAVAEQIRHVHKVEVDVLAADLSVRRELDRVATAVTDPVAPVSLLVNNAGYGLRGRFLEVGVEEHEKQMDTLIRAVLVLSHAAARVMVQRRCGAIINVSSLAGYTAAGPYAASKSWVTVFTESLATELEGTGVTATALLPGFVATEFHERASINVEGLPRVTWLKAPFVVEQALRDAAKGQVLSIPSVKYRAAGEVSRLAPRRLVRMLASPRWEAAAGRRALGRARRRASRRRLKAPWQREDG
ncbi:SDR family NAD(P)-dependent oxidoreductase [Brachybacterium halotolerans subsp. kimchii]|uniref:SDR family NAD(P)-dependent oxidoreductase n=1 Tax=Brachybacterium halotolerans TaxID=2795215 RepID=A0ABS1BBR5_9MICO|nr:MULTISPECIES: SDR family NAD(P)-dependent oxidoreductase [Brachybacterium]MBK0332039.1 SDR family NAD(P)-dependent oxidoreductase [Brachybacterium halotolerans]MCG7310626.1 SDR family NAD(P)-dependent oxidoreductase [Brachybacterium sp. ACRRE]UEJ84111.1 SDR family NAD(P)-dependent oxidoreductase [Brachybacterium halotolerans subsp. kimchii]